MSGEPTAESSPDPSQGAHLRLTPGPLVGAVLCRVVSMMLTRADWPVDRLHDAMLVCDAVSAHAPDYVNDGVVAFDLLPREHEIELRVEQLCAEGAEAIVRDAMLPGVGNVLERIPSSIEVESISGGSRLTLILSRG